MSKKHKRKHKRKPAEANFAPKKKFQDEGINFFAMLCGLVTSFMILFMIFGQFSKSPETARVLKANKSGDEVSGIRTIDDDSFVEVVTSSDADMLVKSLAELDDSSDSTPKARVLAARRRIKIANKMLTMKLTESQRLISLKSKINSLSLIYILNNEHSLNEPSFVESIRAIAGEYAEDADAELARLARISILRVDMMELLKPGRNGGVKPIVGQMVDLLRDMPSDLDLITKCKLIVRTLNDRDRKLGAALVGELNKQKLRVADKSPAGKTMVETLVDDQILIEAKFEQLYDNRRINGEAGQSNLCETAGQLVTRPDAGKYLFSVVDDRVQWFEKDGQYERAKSVYQKMLNSVDNLVDPEASVVARKLAEDGLKRIETIGKPIAFAGTYLDDAPIDPKEFENRVVVVLFWSSKDKQSPEAFTLLSQYAAKWANSPVRMLAVCSDRDLDNVSQEAIVKIAANYKSIKFVAGGKVNPILDHSPSTKTPRVMLVDKKGNVQTTNLPPNETKIEVDFLISD